VAAGPEDLPEIVEVLEKATEGRKPLVDRDALAVGVSVPDGVPVLVQVAAELRGRGLAVADLGLRRPTLDEAFLHLTGGSRG
jgi:ABC-2 type transport system ATP-binding protein